MIPSLAPPRRSPAFASTEPRQKRPLSIEIAATRPRGWQFGAGALHAGLVECARFSGKEAPCCDGFGATAGVRSAPAEQVVKRLAGTEIGSVRVTGQTLPVNYPSSAPGSRD
jgi:hypothetical protein